MWFIIIIIIIAFPAGDTNEKKKRIFLPAYPLRKNINMAQMNCVYLTAGWFCCWLRFEAIQELKTSLFKNKNGDFYFVTNAKKKIVCYQLKKKRKKVIYLQWPTTHSLEQYSSSHSVLVMAGFVHPWRMQWFPVTPPSTFNPPAPGPFTSSPFDAFMLTFPCWMDGDGVIWKYTIPLYNIHTGNNS